MKMKAVILLLTGILFLTSCAGLPTASILLDTDGYLSKTETIDQLDSAHSARLNSFGASLLQQLYTQDKNTFISPASIYLALSMTYNGAAGTTAQEMAQVLSAGDISLEALNTSNKDLQNLLLSNSISTFELSNSIWIRDTFASDVKEDFLQRNKDYYGTMTAALDFDDDASVKRINNWVKDSTNDKIDKAIEGAIDPDTMMYLINTIYFKGDWAQPFKAEDTEKADFFSMGGTESVDMMSATLSLNYMENDLFQAALLPYKDEETSMLVLLPKNDLSDVLPQITGENLTAWLSALSGARSSVQLKLPIMHLEYDADLIPSLKKMGMPTAFTDSADFSNMASGGGLCISEVQHKTFLAVDEKGTEAAAMTKVGMNETSMPISDKIMTVDHPFLVGIVNNKSGAVLFLGTITHPQG